MLKLKLAYFLLLGLFLFSGYNAVAALLQQAQFARQALRPAENRSGGTGFITPGQAQPLQVTLFSNDDDDDDESRSVKKKNSPAANVAALLNSLLQLKDHHYLNPASCFQQDVCYVSSHRYILHCVLKI